MPCFEELLVIVEAIENFLLRFVPDGAGVVENQVGLLDGLYLLVSFVDERANDLFGVVDVHLAAEGFEVESLLGVCGHIQSQYKRCSCGSDTLVRRFWVWGLCLTYS